jgi:hypothetical protein
LHGDFASQRFTAPYAEGFEAADGN